MFDWRRSEGHLYLHLCCRDGNTIMYWLQSSATQSLCNLLGNVRDAGRLVLGCHCTLRSNYILRSWYGAQGTRFTDGWMVGEALPITPAFVRCAHTLWNSGHRSGQTICNQIPYLNSNHDTPGPVSTVMPPGATFFVVKGDVARNNVPDNRVVISREVQLQSESWQNRLQCQVQLVESSQHSSGLSTGASWPRPEMAIRIRATAKRVCSTSYCSMYFD
jgi:hypothetical protein